MTICILAACSDTPVQPAKPGTTTLAAIEAGASGMRVQGRDTVYWGDRAHAMLKERAALYAAAGHPDLVQALDALIWPRRVAERITRFPGGMSNAVGEGGEEELEARARANIPTSSWGARIYTSSTIASASLSGGTVVSSVYFSGTNATNTINLSAKRGDTSVVSPTTVQTSGYGDHVGQCISSIVNLAYCLWRGTYQSSVPVSFGDRKCGVTLTANGSHEVWYGLAIDIQVRAITVSLRRLGSAAYSVDHDDSKSNGECVAPSASFAMIAGSKSASSGGTLSVQTPDINGISVNVASTSSPGGGSISENEWTIDGTSQGGGTGFSQGFSVGSHSLSLTVRNVQGLSSTASGTIEVSLVNDSTTQPPDDSTTPPPGGGPTTRNEYEPGGYDPSGPSGDWECMLYWHEWISYDGGRTWWDNGRTCINWSWAEALRAGPGAAHGANLSLSTLPTDLGKPTPSSSATSSTGRAPAQRTPSVILVLAKHTPKHKTEEGPIAVTRRTNGRGRPLVVLVDEEQLSPDLLAAAFSAVPLLLDRESKRPRRSDEYRVPRDVRLAAAPSAYAAWLREVIGQLSTGDAALGRQYSGERAIHLKLSRTP